MFKKLISALLATTFIAAGTTAFALSKEEVPAYIKDAGYEHSYDTSVFEGHPTFLLEERFKESGDDVLNSDSRLSGWDIDYRGGTIRCNSEGVTRLMDGDPEHKVSMKKQLMTHREGSFTMESSFRMEEAKSGFYYELTGEGKVIVHLETVGSEVCYRNKQGDLVPVAAYSYDKNCGVKIDVDLEEKNVTLTIANSDAVVVPFAEDAVLIDGIYIGTSKEGEMLVYLNYVYAYINYLAFDRFMTANIGETPVGWDGETGVSGVIYMESNETPDVYSYEVKNENSSDKVVLSKEFPAQSGDVVFQYAILFTENSNGGEVAVRSGENNILSIVSKDGNLYVGDELLYAEYKENVWYEIKVVTDSESDVADIYVNNVLRLKNANMNASLNGIDNVVFMTSAESRYYIDDVYVYRHLPLPADYPEAPRTVESDGYDIAMLQYNMWREGSHFGWDRLSPYEERKPYLGWYTEGIPEVADWEIKWLLEHGFDYQVFVYAGVQQNSAAPIKRAARADALIDGFLNSQYEMDFAIMWSRLGEDTLKDYDNFVENVVPYWIEHFFKNPRYKTIDNKPLLFTYNTALVAERLGGVDKLKDAIKLLDDECKKIGYDGILVVADVSAGTNSPEVVKEIGTWAYSYSGWGEAAANSDAVIKVLDGLYEKNEYEGMFASFPQGYNNTPWRVNNIRFMTPEDVEKMCNWLVEAKPKYEAQGVNGIGNIICTCWNEYGEGHFWAPTNLEGFAYLNKVRDAFTDQGELIDEALPSERAIARMGVLYPTGRSGLKTMPDQKERNNVDNLEVLASWDFSKEEDFNCLTARKDIKDGLKMENGAAVGTATGGDPIVRLSLNGNTIPAEKVKAVRVNVYIENGKTMAVYYQTTDDTEIGTNGKRFTAPASMDDYAEYILYPADTSKLTGEITELRLDPDDKAYGKFGFKSVEILGSDEKDLSFYIDDVKYSLDADMKNIGGVDYIDVFRYFYADKRQLVEWDYGTKTFKLDHYGTEVVLKDGVSIMSVDGKNVDMGSAPYYENGRFFIPMRSFFETLGYKIQKDAVNNVIKLYTPFHIECDEVTPYEWTFNHDNNMEGWRASNVLKALVRDGSLRISGTEKKPIIVKDGLDIDASKYKYAIIKVRNTTDNGKSNLYFITEADSTYNSTKRYSVNLNTNEEKGFTKYVIDLTTVSEWTGTVTGLRYDIVKANGAVYIDSIKLVKDYSSTDYEYQLNAYRWKDENFYQKDLAKNEFNFYNLVNDNGNALVTRTDLPLTETVDGYEDVIKILPGTTANNGILSIVKGCYNGSKTSINNLCGSGKVAKISFWYKGIGDCSSITVQNRYSTQTETDGERFDITDISNNQWKYFEGYVILRDVEDGKIRWFSINVAKSSKNALCGAYIRDYKVSLLEDEPISDGIITNDGVVFEVINEGNDSDRGDVFIAGYADNLMKTIVIEPNPKKVIVKLGINKTETVEKSRYYYFVPTIGTTDVKGFLWDGVIPLSDSVELDVIK